MASAVTVGNIRCARCSLVVLQVFPKILQDLMKDSGIPSQKLYNKIIKSKEFRKKLNSEEMNTIQTLVSDGYDKLDVTLIYKIVKYFKIFIPSPSRQWGSNPLSNETEIGDDVERIRRARNHLLHSIKADITEQEMNDFFDRFTEVGNRVDKYLNNQYEGGFEQKIKNFQTQPLTEETAKENLKDLQAIENLKGKNLSTN